MWNLNGDWIKGRAEEESIERKGRELREKMESLRICVSLAATCVSLKLCKGGKILRHLVNQRNKIPEICPRHERKKMRKMFSKSRPLFWDYREILSNYFNELMQLLHFVKYKLRFLLRQ